MIDDNLVQQLLDNYIYHKEKLVKDAGGRAHLDRDRLSTLVRPRMEKLALVIDGWDIKPPVLMDAVFAWAKRNKHPDGPMPNMLYSVKYITKAISNYLQVPYEVVMDKRSMTAFLERMDFEFVRMRKELTNAGVTDLTTATSYPVEFRYLMAIQQFDMESAFFMAAEMLATMSDDARVKLWAEHKGLKYESVATHFNKRKKELNG